MSIADIISNESSLPESCWKLKLGSGSKQEPLLIVLRIFFPSFPRRARLRKQLGFLSVIKAKQRQVVSVRDDSLLSKVEDQRKMRWSKPRLNPI